jgi:hypothetical protein
LATKINSEFAAIQKADQDANKTVVQRAITFGGTLSQAKEKVRHGKWEKWLNDNCRDISARTAQRYMKLADSPEVRAEIGKNDTVSFLSLRAAAIAGFVLIRATASRRRSTVSIAAASAVSGDRTSSCNWRGGLKSGSPFFFFAVIGLLKNMFVASSPFWVRAEAYVSGQAFDFT